MIAEALMRLTTNPAFRFLALIQGDPLGAFTECTLPVIEWDVKEVMEGGLNTYVHSLPGRRKKATLTLGNGLGMGPMLIAWYMQSMQQIYMRKPVTVILLNSLMIPVTTLHIEDCIPTKWTGPQLKTGENTIAIQSLEIACGDITLIPV